MMSPSDLDNQVYRVQQYLKNENAVRSNVEEVETYKSVFEICEALDIYVGNWTKVKNAMLKRGIPICYKPGRGHYLGFKGEEVSNYVYKYQIAKGWVKHLHATKDAIRTASPEAKKWIERRFKNFTVEEEVENAEAVIRA